MAKQRAPGTGLRRLVSRLLMPDAPIPSTASSAARWDTEYSSGRWDYLGQLSELSRFSVLAGYVGHFKPGGSILDVGCGEGVLADRLGPSSFSRYEGVDLSAVAIDRATRRSRPNTTFTAADAEVYVPGQTFDTIVFNEVLYLLHEPLRTVERYLTALNDRGVLMVSINTAFRGGMAILRQLKSRCAVLDETRVTHGHNRWSWVCTVLSDGREGDRRRGPS